MDDHNLLMVPDEVWEVHVEKGESDTYFSSKSLDSFRLTAHPSQQAEVGKQLGLISSYINFLGAHQHL